MEQGQGGLRASEADREQAVEALKAAFVQDWLAKAEFEARVAADGGAAHPAEHVAGRAS